MNNQEGFDLAKMAVSVLMLSLLIGAVMSVWYFMFGTEQKLQASMDKATRSAAVERLYELEDVSNAAKEGSGQYPLVTNVVNILSEFNEQDLLFIYVDVTENGNDFYNGALYTYEGVVLGGIDTTGLPDPNKISCTQPVTEACKKLLLYSRYRCYVDMFETKYDNMVYTGIRVSVIVE